MTAGFREHQLTAADFEADSKNSEPEQKLIKATLYVWTAPEAIPAREWLYGRHLIRKYVSATVAPGGIGKTSLGIAETLAMVSGRNLLGKSSIGCLRAWYLNLEDPRDEVTRQIQAAALYYGLTPDDLDGRLFVDSGREQQFIIAEMTRNGAVICKPVVDAIVDELRRHKIDVLTVDPFVSSHAVPENDNGAMDLVVKQWGRVADAANCSVHLIHHTRKAMGDLEVSAESARGAKSLTDGCRSVRVLNRMTKDEARKAGIDDPRCYFRVYTDKANLAPPSDKSSWYRLESVSLGNGGSGPSDAVGVVTTWTWPDAFEGVTTDDLRRVQAAIANGEWRADVRATAWAGHAVAEALGLDASNMELRAKIQTLRATWIKSGALKVERKRDEKRHAEVAYVEVGAWADEA